MEEFHLSTWREKFKVANKIDVVPVVVSSGDKKGMLPATSGALRMPVSSTNDDPIAGFPSQVANELVERLNPKEDKSVTPDTVTFTLKSCPANIFALLGVIPMLAALTCVTIIYSIKPKKLFKYIFIISIHFY